MAVYIIALSGPDPFERLIADPETAGLPGELESTASYCNFWPHVFWPQNGALYAIVEGDGDVYQLAGLLGDTVAGGGWEADVTRVTDAEDPPEGLEAGAQQDWVIEAASLSLPQGAVEPAVRQCRLCHRPAVPPHGPGCRAERSDGGMALPRPINPTIDVGGGGADRIDEPHPAELSRERLPVT